MIRRRTWFLIASLTCLALILPIAAFGAATINLADYWFCRGVGDSWTFGYTNPLGALDFTVAITRVTSDPYAGKLRMGDFREPNGFTWYQIVSYDASYFYLYYSSKNNQTYNPAVQMPLTYELETMVANPANPATGAWYFKKLDKLTVPAGTYTNILLKLDLDKNYGPNVANNLFGLPTSITYGVTHAGWYGRYAGELQDMDFDALTGAIGDTYTLKSTNVNPNIKKSSPSLSLLLD